jgi:hypothetical protein
MKPRETVDRLIALAIDPAATIDEARTAAFAAVRLIDEHKLLDRRARASGSEVSEMFEFRSILEKVQSADFEGAIRVIESLRRRAEHMSQKRIRNLRRDMEDNPTWTEQTQHAARRASNIDQCAHCKETILLWTWMVNPFRESIAMHLRCFRDGSHDR